MLQDILASVLPFMTLASFITSGQAISSPAPKTPPQPKEEKAYVWHVKKGDALSTIALSEYGKTDYWTNIWNDNPWIKTPNVIEEKWKIKLSSNKPTEVAKLTPEQASVLVYAKATYSLKTAPTEATPATETKPSSYDSVYQEAGAKYDVP